MKRLCLILCAAVLALASAVALAEDDPGRQTQYDLGMQQIADGNYEEALDTFSLLGHYKDSYDKAYLLRSQVKSSLTQLNSRAALIACTNEVSGEVSYGLVNFETNKMISPCWSDVKIYTEDRIAVKNSLQVAGNDKWGISDDNGKMCHKYLWSNVSEDAVDGVFVTMNYTHNQPRYGLATINGKVLVSCRWTTLGDLNESSGSLNMPSFPCGLIRVCDAYGNWGYADAAGKIRIRLHYAAASDFSEEDGLAQVTVRRGRKQYISYINTKDQEAYFEKGAYVAPQTKGEELKEKIPL